MPLILVRILGVFQWTWGHMFHMLCRRMEMSDCSVQRLFNIRASSFSDLTAVLLRDRNDCLLARTWVYGIMKQT